MTANPAMEIRVWGARGSIPTPTAENLGYGGNTSCVEAILSTGESFIFDAGTGIRNLGIAQLAALTKRSHIHLFLTHFHWDHLQGLPFFPPLYDPSKTITFHSARPIEELKEILRAQMVSPYFPIMFDKLPSTIRFEHVGETALDFGPARICSFPLNHPQGAHGYRVETAGASFVYATDHEHGDHAADAVLRRAAQNADVLFYDAQFTPGEYPSHRGWGHGTWLEGTCVAKDAGVKRLVLFHHDPGHNDRQIDSMLALAQQQFPLTMAASEGSTIPVGAAAVEHGKRGRTA